MDKCRKRLKLKILYLYFRCILRTSFCLIQQVVTKLHHWYCDFLKVNQTKYCHLLLCSILQRGVRPSCWPAALSTMPFCSLDLMPGQWRRWLLLSSQTVWNRGLRLMTAKQKEFEDVSYSNTLTEDWINNGSRTVILKSSLKTKVCWCSFLIFCWFYSTDYTTITYLDMDEHARHYTRKSDVKPLFKLQWNVLHYSRRRMNHRSHWVWFKFKQFLSSSQSSLELSCFYFFPFLNVQFNLKINVHNTKQGPYLQNNCTLVCHGCTVRHYDCWRWQRGWMFF